MCNVDISKRQDNLENRRPATMQWTNETAAAHKNNSSQKSEKRPPSDASANSEGTALAEEQVYSISPDKLIIGAKEEAAIKICGLTMRTGNVRTRLARIIRISIHQAHRNPGVITSSWLPFFLDFDARI